MNRPALCIALLALGAPCWAQSSKLTVPKAGEIEVRHGTVRWREELYKQAQPGTTWRMGSGGATTLETKAALVWPEGIVFPGTYNLGARKVDDDRWDLIVHQDGNQYRNQKTFGVFPMTRTEVADRLATEALVIEFALSKDKEERKRQGVEFHLRFGPHDTANRLRAFAAGRAKAKIGKIPVEIEFAKLPTLPEYERVFAAESGAGFTLARLHLPRREEPVRLEIAPGETPTLRLVELAREIQGTRAEATTAANELKIGAKDDALVFTLGKAELRFPITESALEAATRGGATPGGGQGQ